MWAQEPALGCPSPVGYPGMCPRCFRLHPVPAAPGGPFGVGTGAAQLVQSQTRLSGAFPSQHNPFKSKSGFFTLPLIPAVPEAAPNASLSLTPAPCPAPSPCPTNLPQVSPGALGGADTHIFPLLTGLLLLPAQVVPVPRGADAAARGAGGAGLRADAGRHVLQRLGLPRGARGLRRRLLRGVPAAQGGLGVGTPPSGHCGVLGCHRHGCWLRPRPCAVRDAAPPGVALGPSPGSQGAFGHGIWGADCSGWGC